MADSNEPVVRVAVGTERAAAVAAAAREAAPAGVTVREVGSPGAEALAPLVLVTLDGRTAFHGASTPADARDLVASAADGLPTADADAVVSHDADRRTLPVPDDGPLAVGRRRVLGPCGWVASDDPDALATRTSDAPDDVEAAVREAGLLGRGRGDAATDAPVHDQWERVRAADGDPVVVVNGNEADPRNRTDGLLAAGAPLHVLDAALAVAGVVGAEDVVVYLNEADAVAARRIRAAVEALDPDPRPQVVTGPDRYIAGEETMALEALEGADRLEARLRPPGPAEHGLYGRPTAVHTPRTLAQARRATRAPGEFDPDAADPGTRLVTVAGDVSAPATVELPTSGSLEAVRAAVDLEGEFKMACVGGQFGGLTRSLSRSPAAPSLSPDLGTGGVVELLSRDRCAVATAGERVRFAHEENCGRCVPCREGSTQLLDLLRDVYGGAYRDDDVRELARVMRESSTCAFGRAAARPATTAMDEFETEFRAHADGRCPSGACDT